MNVFLFRVYHETDVVLDIIENIKSDSDSDSDELKETLELGYDRENENIKSDSDELKETLELGYDSGDDENEKKDDRLERVIIGYDLLSYSRDSFYSMTFPSNHNFEQENHIDLIKYKEFIIVYTDNYLTKIESLIVNRINLRLYLNNKKIPYEIKDTILILDPEDDRTLEQSIWCIFGK
jgi:hypothetical protein